MAQHVLDPLWDNVDWAIGQLLMVGWDGTEVTPQIRSLIEDYHVGSIILAPKNLQSATHATNLVKELQTIAHKAGHPRPLMVGVDQENGGVNSLFDESCVCQFPSAMGVAATGDTNLARAVSAASADQVAAVGCNLMFGPVLDVLANSNSRSQPLGVRATSDDPREVSAFGLATMEGAKSRGVACCGKHFPSYGNLDFRGVMGLGMPVITQTIEELALTQLVPFRDAIANGLDAMMIGGCAISNHNMSAMHACLSGEIVDNLLRNELGFDGVAISECLEMETVRDEMGVQNGVLMAVEAGCDNVMLCRAFDTQIEALRGLKLAVENGVLSMERIHQSIRRINRLKAKTTSWERALNPPGVDHLAQLHSTNVALSKKAYDDSIVVVRDNEKLLPLSSSMKPSEELLLLTPLVKRLPSKNHTTALEAAHLGGTMDQDPIMSGEDVFRELGRSLARARGGKLLHTSYTASGVRPVHENLIERASCIIIVTADSQRNLYQAGFVKHVHMLVETLRSRGEHKKLMAVAVSSPYDLVTERSVGTYVCTFDFTDNAMNSLVRALFGEFKPAGSLPGTLRRKERPSKTTRLWLAEAYSPERDATALTAFLATTLSEQHENTGRVGALSVDAGAFSLPGGTTMAEAHFVVRNSTTGAILGIITTYAVGNTGIIGALMVSPSKRKTGIGRALYQRAMRVLLGRPGIEQLQLGIFAGMAAMEGPGAHNKALEWFEAVGGWDVSQPRRMVNMALFTLRSWGAPDGLLQSIQAAGLSFDLVRGSDSADSDAILSFISPHAALEYGEMYALALRESPTGTCGIIRAKNSAGDVLGTIIVCGANSVLRRYVVGLVPSSDRAKGDIGGIVAPVVDASLEDAHMSLVLQGLVLMGIRQNRGYGATAAVLCGVHESSSGLLEDMGFIVSVPFDKATNPVERLKSSGTTSIATIHDITQTWVGTSM